MAEAPGTGLLTRSDRRADWLNVGQALYRMLLDAASEWVFAGTPWYQASTLGSGVRLLSSETTLDVGTCGPATEDGSLTDLAVVLSVPVTAEEVNDAFRRASTGHLAGVLKYSAEPLVSRDIIGERASCVFDSQLTQANGQLVKAYAWYDNEWGYSCRLADLAAMVGTGLTA